MAATFSRSVLVLMFDMGSHSLHLIGGEVQGLNMMVFTLWHLSYLDQAAARYSFQHALPAGAYARYVSVEKHGVHGQRGFVAERSPKLHTKESTTLCFGIPIPSFPLVQKTFSNRPAGSCS